ncbi:hypothetical protein ACFTAO_17030 [Paenibacillus rhizoplanae]
MFAMGLIGGITGIIASLLAMAIGGVDAAFFRIVGLQVLQGWQFLRYYSVFWE